MTHIWGSYIGNEPAAWKIPTLMANISQGWLLNNTIDTQACLSPNKVFTAGMQGCINKHTPHQA